MGGAGLRVEGGELRNSPQGFVGRSPGKGLAQGWMKQLLFSVQASGSAGTEMPGPCGHLLSLSWAESGEEVLCPVFWQPLTKPTDTVHQPQRAWQMSRGGNKYDCESDLLPGLHGAIKVHRRRAGKVLPQEFFLESPTLANFHWGSEKYLKIYL